MEFWYKMKRVSSYPISIYVGFKNINTGEIGNIENAEKICQRYCDNIGFCVSLTSTKFIYTNGSEPGCIVGLINYPRFPSSKEQLMSHAIKIAHLLMEEYKQFRVSIVAPDETIMLEEDLNM